MLNLLFESLASCVLFWFWSFFFFFLNKEKIRHTCNLQLEPSWAQW